MALPDFSMRQLLEAGVHFGHQAHRWNPKMGEYIFGARNNIHIIDLAQIVPMLHRALQAVSDTVAKGGRILFVGTKRQAQDAIADAAKKSRAVLRQFALARRHADQLEDHLRVDHAAAQARRDARLRRGAGLHQEGAPDLAARARQARPLARRHQGHGRPARPAVRDRHQQGRHRDQGGAAAGRAGRRRGRHQLRSRRHHISWCPATTTPAARSRSIAIWWRKAAIDGISRAQGELGIDVGAAAEPIVGRAAGGRPKAQASSRCPVRAASPTISRSSRASRRRSRRSSTISASSTTGRSPGSAPTPPTRSAKRWDCPAASKAGSRRPRN